MKKYLFLFGYETPTQAQNNEQHGWDDEESIAFFVEADCETDADDWGKVVAQMFLNALYEEEYKPPLISDYDNGIEPSPETRFDASYLSEVSTLTHGDIEGLNQAVESWL